MSAARKLRSVSSSASSLVEGVGAEKSSVISFRIINGYGTDLKVSLEKCGSTIWSTAFASITISQEGLKVIRESVFNGCSYRTDKIACEIFLYEGKKMISIQNVDNPNSIMCPFDQTRILKVVHTMYNIDKFRAHTDKKAIKSDVEGIVFISLQSLHQRMNAFSESNCPGCGENSTDDTKHFCGYYTVGHKLIQQSRFRACEAVASKEKETIVNEVNKIYSVFNIQDKYKIPIDNVLLERVKKVCILKEERPFKLVDKETLQFVYDRFFYQDVDFIAIQVFPARNSMEQFIR